MSDCPAIEQSDHWCAPPSGRQGYLYSLSLLTKSPWNFARFLIFPLKESLINCFYDFKRPNGEWNLLKTSVKKNELTELRSDGIMTKHWEVIFSIVTKRRTSYYVTGILLPVFLLSYLNTLVFVLPVESGEKVPGLTYIYTMLLYLYNFSLLFAFKLFRPDKHSSKIFLFLYTNLRYEKN